MGYISDREAMMELLGLMLGEFNLVEVLEPPHLKQDDTLTLLQKYQSIGTPEEIVERINKLNSLVERSLKHMKELKAYRATGYTPEELSTHQTIDEFVASLRH